MAAETNDSGMASAEESKDVTPEKPKSIVNDKTDHHDDDEEFEEETITERLIGLTEMFPEPVVNFTISLGRTTKEGIKGFYNFSRNALWIVASSSLLLFGPLIFEVERAQLEESQRSQQKQFLLGPNTVSSNLGPNMALTSPR